MGEMNGAKLLDIMAVQPTIRDRRRGSLWIDSDVFGAGSPVKGGGAGGIVAIVTADEQEEPPHQG
jgi:hypothetical protein